MSHGDAPTIRANDVKIPDGHRLARMPRVALSLGVIGVGASFAIGSSNPKQLAHSWLVAFMFFLSIALGGLFFVLTHYATKASWSVVVRRIGEYAMITLPLFALLFVPIYFMWGHDLFHWMDTEAVEHDALLQGKAGYLNAEFFGVRALIYFAAWSLMAWWFWRGSQRQDATGDRHITKRMIQLSAPALMVFALTLSFAAIDWIMSLDPHWYSTMFGVYYFAGALVGFFAFASILTVILQSAGLLGGAVTTEHVHDLGKLLFTFTVFWAYIAFSQYFLIWYGNIPEETVFYEHRAHGGWEYLTLLLGWGHFGVPFFFLMSRHIKRSVPLLIAGSVWMLLMHYVDLYWLIMPNLHHEGVHFSALDVTTLIGIGGLFDGVVLLFMRRGALVPLRDPRIDDSLRFENA